VKGYTSINCNDTATRDRHHARISTYTNAEPSVTRSRASNRICRSIYTGAVSSRFMTARLRDHTWRCFSWPIKIILYVPVSAVLFSSSEAYRKTLRCALH